jgi:hypothetical protein
MKGVELPINTIVIVVIALAILLALIALFFGVWTPGSSGITLDAAKNNACHMLVSTGCRDAKQINVRDFDADKDGILDTGSSGTRTLVCVDGEAGGNDNLFMLCKCWYGITGTDDPSLNLNCRRDICNCED